MREIITSPLASISCIALHSHHDHVIFMFRLQGLSLNNFYIIIIIVRIAPRIEQL